MICIYHLNWTNILSAHLLNIVSAHHLNIDREKGKKIRLIKIAPLCNLFSPFKLSERTCPKDEIYYRQFYINQ